MTRNEKRFVPGCPGYKADRQGNIYGLDGRRMKPFVDRSGAVRINLVVNGQQNVTHYVPRMICAAFHTSVVLGRDIAVRDHKYRSKRINKADRLKWGTQRNVKRKATLRKLDDKQKIDIYNLSQLGWTQHDLANKFGVSQPAICYVLKGFRNG